jgi:hypothetical protein
MKSATAAQAISPNASQHRDASVRVRAYAQASVAPHMSRMERGRNSAVKLNRAVIQC